MCKSMEYEEMFKQDQNPLKDLTTETVVRICGDKAKIKLAIPLKDSMELRSFNKSINNFNFCFSNKKIPLVVDNKTNNQ